LKAIGATNGAQVLLDIARVEKDAGVTGLGIEFIAAAKLRHFGREESIRSLA
jgi:catalase